MNFKYAFFLGSHPAISANEAFGQLNLLGFSPAVVAVANEYLIVTLAEALPEKFLTRLGGTTRIAQIIGEQSAPWDAEAIWKKIFSKDPKKVTIGLGSLGGSSDELRPLAGDLKDMAREYKTKLRFILPRGKFTLLNAAQVIFNDLLEAPNAEVVFIQHEQTYYIAKTTHVQDIAAYELRDTKRPERDPRVGMLPPKLAQIMLNLATNHLPPSALPYRILDPFCGLGTIIQEGWLQGHTMIGSDSNRNNTAAAQKNVAWTMTHFASPAEKPNFRYQDVKEPLPASWQSTLDAIVTEPFLGRPLHSPLTGKKAHTYLAQLADLYYTFFKQAFPALKPGGVVLIVFPALRQEWKGDTFSLMPPDFLDAIGQLGYIPKQLSYQELGIFPASDRHSLLYSRPDALTGRELTLWVKRS